MIQFKMMTEKNPLKSKNISIHTRTLAHTHTPAHTHPHPSDRCARYIFMTFPLGHFVTFATIKTFALRNLYTCEKQIQAERNG